MSDNVNPTNEKLVVILLELDKLRDELESDKKKVEQLITKIEKMLE